MPEKRKSAFLKATQEAQQPSQASEPLPTQQNTVSQLPRSTVTPLDSNTVIQPEPAQKTSTKAKPLKKMSFYLTEEQEEILDQLELAFRQQKRKINRNEIVRYLIDHYGTFEHVQELLK